MGTYQKGPDGRDGGNVASNERRDIFTCNGEGCLVTERASEMFNLSCNPHSVTMPELRQKARCRRCAEEIARKRGKRLGEPGCGVYPLGQTLRTTERGSGAGMPAVEMPTYGCGLEGCGVKLRAEEMYNLQCNISRANVEALAPLIRCKRHAEEAAAPTGRKLCEPGSGVYRLSFTLRWLGAGTARTVQEQSDNEYLRWVLETKSKRETKDRDERIRQYAQAYAESPLHDGSSEQVAAPSRHDHDGRLVCGLPIECCDHDKPVGRYLTALGEVVGICDDAAAIFSAVYEESKAAHGEDRRYRRLLSTADESEARALATAWGADRRHGRRG